MLDFPGLLPIGLHQKSLRELKTLCVDNFHGRSSTRQGLMNQFESFLGELVNAGIQARIWVDGSFLTEKIDPNDIDILLVVKEEFFDNASTQQKNLLDWANSPDPRTRFKCDSYVWAEPEILDSQADWWRSYWIRQFGFDRQDCPRGMAVIELPGGLL